MTNLADKYNYPNVSLFLHRQLAQTININVLLQWSIFKNKFYSIKYGFGTFRKVGLRIRWPHLFWSLRDCSTRSILNNLLQGLQFIILKSWQLSKSIHMPWKAKSFGVHYKNCFWFCSRMWVIKFKINKNINIILRICKYVLFHPYSKTVGSLSKRELGSF